MQPKRTIIIVMFLLGFGLLGLTAQQTVSPAGGNASGSGGKASYTVGQVMYTLKGGSSGSLSEGVQQPYEIYIISGIVDPVNIALELLVYPNPVSGEIKLIVEDYAALKLTYKLYDIGGKLILQNNVLNLETIISMKTLASSTYFLSVMQSNKELKTFKIIKN